MSQILTVESALPETRMLSFSSMPLVSDWWPVSVWMQLPVSTSHTLIDVSSEPLTTWIPSNWERQEAAGEANLCLNLKSAELAAAVDQQHFVPNNRPET